MTTQEQTKIAVQLQATSEKLMLLSHELETLDASDESRLVLLVRQLGESIRDLKEIMNALYGPEGPR